jgi:hypothetical protein
MWKTTIRKLYRFRDTCGQSQPSIGDAQSLEETK